MKNNTKYKNIKSKKIRLALLFVIALFIVGTVLNTQNKKTPEKEVHLHAGFLVYLDGKLQDFSDLKYMSIAPCEDEDTPHKALSKEEEQLEKAHLHDKVGDIVHVHREGTVWEDLFKNLNYSFPDKNQIRGFLNGEPLNNILSYKIKPYDSVIIVSGDTNDINLNQFVTKDHIIEIEQKSENCGI